MLFITQQKRNIEKQKAFFILRQERNSFRLTNIKIPG